MDEAAPVNLAECRRHADGDAQEATQLDRLPLAPVKDSIQGYAARVLEYQHRPPFVASECQRPACPSGIQFGLERVFVLESPQALSRGLFRGKRYRQDRDWAAALPAAIM